MTSFTAWRLFLPVLSTKLRTGEYTSSRMLKKSASGVLASRRGSTYQPVRLASSLAAALLDGLFEHPVAVQATVPLEAFWPLFFAYTEFFRSLLVTPPVRILARPPMQNRPSDQGNSLPRKVRHP